MPKHKIDLISKQEIAQLHFTRMSKHLGLHLDNLLKQLPTYLVISSFLNDVSILTCILWIYLHNLVLGSHHHMIQEAHPGVLRIIHSPEHLI